jgi:hypothetical protein
MARSRVELSEQIRRDWRAGEVSIRERPRPALDPYTQVIDGWLLADRDVPRKQRHTARLGVVRAREGDLQAAVDQGLRALTGARKSLPSLVMVSRDLTKVLDERYSAETGTRDYLAALTPVPARSSWARLR